MGAEDRLVVVRHAPDDGVEEGSDLVRRGIADRVRQVDRRGACVDNRSTTRQQEVGIAAGRVLGRKLDVVCEPPACVTAADGRSRRCSRVMRSLRSRCRSEVAMKVWIRRRSAGCSALAGALDVARAAARQRRDHGPSHLVAITPHRFGIGLRGDREAGLDDVYAQRRRADGPAAASPSSRIEKPGACSPSRRVVSKIVTGSA